MSKQYNVSSLASFVYHTLYQNIINLKEVKYVKHTQKMYECALTIDTEVGTDIHRHCELYMSNKLKDDVYNVGRTLEILKMLLPGYKYQCEKSVCRATKHRRIVGYIDLLCIHKNDVYIVDYKTGVDCEYTFQSGIAQCMIYAWIIKMTTKQNVKGVIIFNPITLQYCKLDLNNSKWQGIVYKEIIRGYKFSHIT